MTTPQQVDVDPTTLLSYRSTIEPLIAQVGNISHDPAWGTHLEPLLGTVGREWVNTYYQLLSQWVRDITNLTGDLSRHSRTILSNAEDYLAAESGNRRRLDQVEQPYTTPPPPPPPLRAMSAADSGDATSAASVQAVASPPVDDSGMWDDLGGGGNAPPGSTSGPTVSAATVDATPSSVSMAGGTRLSGCGYDNGEATYAGSVGGRHIDGPGPEGGPPTALPTGRRAQWVTQALDILHEMGYDTSKISPADIEAIIQHESGGNPHAINLSDSNAASGHPSKGLMQCIDSTFQAHMAPGHNDIWNPVDNIVAGVRYAISRYGSVDNVPGVVALHRGDGYVGY